MARPRFLRALTLSVLAFPFLVGCASINAYRPTATVVHSQYTIIENFGTSEIDPVRVDELLRHVAYLLGVELSPRVPKPRIVVTTPDRIAELYRAGAATFPGAAYAVALYFPGVSLVLVPHVDRSLLGHELAHYVTDHYLTHAERSEWEAIAERVEGQL